MNLIIKLNNTPFLIPDDITCVPAYIFTGVTLMYSLVIIYLVREKTRIEKEHAQDIADHISDLKEQRIAIQSICDKKTNLILTNLEKQITKLEVVLSNLNK